MVAQPGVGLLPVYAARQQEELARWRKLNQPVARARARVDPGDSGYSAGRAHECSQSPQSAPGRRRSHSIFRSGSVGSHRAGEREAHELQAIATERRELMARQKAQSKEIGRRALRIVQQLQSEPVRLSLDTYEEDEPSPGAFSPPDRSARHQNSGGSPDNKSDRFRARSHPSPGGSGFGGTGTHSGWCGEHGDESGAERDGGGGHGCWRDSLVEREEEEEARRDRHLVDPGGRWDEEAEREGETLRRQLELIDYERHAAKPTHTLQRPRPSPPKVSPNANPTCLCSPRYLLRFLPTPTPPASAPPDISPPATTPTATSARRSVEAAGRRAAAVEGGPVGPGATRTTGPRYSARAPPASGETARIRPVPARKTVLARSIPGWADPLTVPALNSVQTARLRTSPTYDIWAPVIRCILGRADPQTVSVPAPALGSAQTARLRIIPTADIWAREIR